jgi:acyl carrier protein
MQTVLRLSDEDVARVGPDTTPLQVPGWNSLAHVQIILELERTFGVMFDADEIAALASVSAIIAALERPRP